MTRRVFAPLFVPLLLLTCIVAAGRAEERNVAVVGDLGITERDLLFMISANAGDEGDGLRTGMALVQMDERARIEMINQMADELLLSLAAREAGLDRNPAAEQMLRWQEIRTLAGLYLADASRRWDTGEAAARKYFGDHPEEFAQAEAVRMKYIALDPGEDMDALSSDIASGAGLRDVAQKRNVPLDSQGFTESEWMERGLVLREFEDAFFSTDGVGLLPPIKSDSAIYVVEITARRPKRQMSWEEAAPEAAGRLQRFLLRNEIESLKQRRPVSIDVEALNGLGRIEPAE
ncbi:MAG: peptidyl-prolyl cis-trans isomerase [Synergistaceae bacterium]|jgi:peptidyl-prolyl cis-trans isomerase C|nr:peptidyl-prolyl cis-trans isomerase [Synergistaceae bacterium]